MALSESKFQELVDREEIRDVLARYCRGLDRCDLELMQSTYHADAVDDHGIFTGNAHDFCKFMIDQIQEMYTDTMHVIANNIIEFDGPEVAYSECYLLAWHRAVGDQDKIKGLFGDRYVENDGPPPGPGYADGAHYNFFAGRYVDRMEKRAGEWRIANRLVVHDWNLVGPATSIWDQGANAFMTIRGQRSRADAAYRRD